MELFNQPEKSARLDEEQLKWNEMWKLWAEKKTENPYTALMTYDSEVNNGGHEQYFSFLDEAENLKKEMSELDSILPAALNDNLRKAYTAYMALKNNGEGEQAEEDMENCDGFFYENEEKIIGILKEYAKKMEVKM